MSTVFVGVSLQVPEALSLPHLLSHAVSSTKKQQTRQCRQAASHPTRGDKTELLFFLVFPIVYQAGPACG